jgi:hypothetical protein
MEDKTAIGITGIAALTSLQFIAWYTGHNGTVFALTSAGIGTIIGSYFGNILDKVKK